MPAFSFPTLEGTQELARHLANGFTTMGKAWLWWRFHKRMLAFWGASLALVSAFCVMNIPFGQTKALEQALSDKDGDTILAMLHSGLNPNTYICADYQIAIWAGIFPISRLPNQSLPRACSGKVPLLVAAVEAVPPNPTLVNDLLQRKVNANTKDTWGTSALEYAVQAGDEQAVDLLLKYGADPLAPTSHGTALHLAATQKSVAVVRVLLRHVKKVDTFDADKGTALIDASHQPNAPIAELLLQQGANPNVCNDHGLTPLQAAFNANWTNANGPVIRLLQRYGASLYQKKQIPSNAT